MRDLMKTFVVVLYLHTSLSALAGIETQCLSCHGENKNMGMPRIHGQREIYLQGQLWSFKQGLRTSVVMNSVAANLSFDDINQLSHFFSTSEFKKKVVDYKPTSDSIASGRAKVGDIGCSVCHGANLEGSGVAPRLRGQDPFYLQRQLMAFKLGERSNDGGVMFSFAKLLDDESITQISDYIYSLED